MNKHLSPGLDRGSGLHPDSSFDPALAPPHDLAPETVHSPRSIGRSDIYPQPEGASLYLGGPTRPGPLSREQEVDLARRVDAGERAILRALVKSPAALRELGAIGQELADGRLQTRDLLRSSDDEEPAREGALRNLTATLERARSLARAAHRRAPVDPEARRRLLRRLEATRLHRRILDRVAAAVRAAPATTKAAQRVLAAIDEGCRAADRAKAELVRANIGLVFMFAKRNVKHGLPLHDLVQEGNIGLMRAVDKFDPERGLRFSTYAAWWVRQQMTRAVLDQARTIRVPVHLADARQKLRRAQRVFEAAHGRSPSEVELGEQSGLFPEKVRAVLGLTPEPLSLDAATGADHEGHIGDFIEDRTTRAPDEEIAHTRMRAQTKRLLDRLAPREQDILRRRFGLDGALEQTLQEIGDSLSISRERVRQIESEALRKLRAPSKTAELDSYLAA